MRKIYISILFVLGLMNLEAQDFKKHIDIIQSVFIESELIEINEMNVIQTKARGKFAHIPINSSACYLTELSDDLSVLAFNIYLSENKDDYGEMEENDISNVFDIDESSDLKRLTKNERFIQVIFFNPKEKKYIGKPDNFPIERLDWLPEGMGDFTEFLSINSLKEVEGSNTACVLQLYECPSCNNFTYVFKLKEDKILSSRKLKGCYSDFEESPNNIECNCIINCYEVDYEEAEPVVKRKNVLKW